MPRDGRGAVTGLGATVAAALLIFVPGASATVQYVSKDTMDPEKIALSVPCPAGTHVTGGGTDTANGYKGLRLRGSYPIDDASDADAVPDDGWRVDYTNVDGFSVEVFAACASGLPTYKSAAFNIQPTSRGGAGVGCGYREVYSGGARGGTLVSVLPGDGSDADSEPDDSFKAKLDNPRSTTAQATVYAVCGPTTPTYRTKSKSLDAKKENEFDIGCPVGVPVIGGGAGISAKYHKGLINSLFPFMPDGDGFGAYLDNYSDGSKPITVAAICANLA